MNLIYLQDSILPDWPISEASLTADHLASRRLRAVLPARHLSNRGYNIKVQKLGCDFMASECSDEISWLIIGKISHPEPNTFRSLADSVDSLVKEAKRRGVGVLVDYTDDILIACDHRSDWTFRLLQRADRIVCASEFLASSVRRSNVDSAGIIVIPDPVEGVRQPAHCLQQACEPLRLVWFGHPTNLQPMLQWIPSLDVLNSHSDITLEIVAGLAPKQLAVLSAQLQQLFLGYTITLTSWNGQATVYEALRRSHVALIPIDMRGPKAAVSNNRLTEALWAGCFVVGSPVSSYLPFYDCTWLGEDLVAGVRWAIEHPDLLPEMVSLAQDRIGAEFTPAAIGNQWQHALGQINTSSR